MLVVLVNSPSIAGTGRVGPRQRSRVTYSSHSDVEVNSGETDSFSWPKSFEDKTKGIYHDNLQKSPNARKTQPLQRRKDLGNKSPYFRKKEIGMEDTSENAQKQHETELRSSHAPEEHKDSRKSESKFEKLEENNTEPAQNDHTNTEQSDTTASYEPDAMTEKLNNCDNQSNDSSTQMNVMNETHAEIESDSTLKKLELTPVSQVKIEVEISEAVDMVESESNKTEIVQATVLSECKAAETDLITSVAKDTDDNDKNKTEFMVDTLCDINNDAEKINVVKNEDQNLSMEQIEEVTSDNCDSKRNENANEQENDVKCDMKDSTNKKEADNVISSSPADASSMIEENNKSESDDKTSKEKILVDNGIAAKDEKINTDDKQYIVMTCINETQERTIIKEEEKKNEAANDVVDTVESLESDLQADKEKAVSNEVIETEKTIE